MQTNIGAFLSYDRSDLCSHNFDCVLLSNSKTAAPQYTAAITEKDLLQRFKTISGKIVIYGNCFSNLLPKNLFLDLKSLCGDFNEDWDPEFNLYQTALLFIDYLPPFRHDKNYIRSKLSYECRLLKLLYKEINS
ncbi:hypothetical protein [Succinatimonas hippei]|uniref:hypothetical protein n=1 Tax=Succinatimonas hippei TaxID=626938 RepID=UPI0023F6A6E5|nr:hypothetical protein [Succinatimonas hippei]